MSEVGIIVFASTSQDTFVGHLSYARLCEAKFILSIAKDRALEESGREKKSFDRELIS